MKKTLAVVAGLSLIAIGCSTMSGYKTASTFTKTNKAAKKYRKIASNSDHLTPNSVRYRESGALPETGRSGARKIQAWGLLNQEGVTTVYVTTGNVQTGTVEAGTSLTKVQLKANNSNGETFFNQEHNQLSNNGSASFTTDQLGRSQALKVQANVSKEGDKRNYVVSVNTKVYRLPDLKADKIQAPAEAFINHPVEIMGTIKELNGDIGAKADCVLYIDGAEAERAPGIWVDAADSVLCRFEKSFATTGSRQLKIAAENVNPTDWDNGNNAITQNINIVNNRLPLLTDWRSFNDSKEAYHYRYSYGASEAGSITYDNYQQSSNYSGHIDEVIDTNSAWTLEATETSGSSSLTTSSALSNCYSDPGYYTVCYNYDYANNTSYQATAYTAYNTTYVYYSRYYYRVVYHGSSGTYSYIAPGSEVTSGAKLNVGSDWGTTIRLGVGAATYEDVKAPVALQPMSSNYAQPWTCWSDYYGQYCYEYSSDFSGVYYNGN